jgi:magnesium-protoporphyrin O-methyltransferase
MPGVTIPEADIVLMHRVVCCTPDAGALLVSAGARARQRMVLTYPGPAVWLQLGQRAINAAAAMGWGWRFHVHAPEGLLGAAPSAGLRLRTTERGPIRQVAVLER